MELTPPVGLQLVWDGTRLDSAWVLWPGLCAVGVALGLLLSLRRGRPRTRCALAAVFWLFAVWWTLGGVGAWRAALTRVGNGTANVAEGLLDTPATGDVLRVGDVVLHRPKDALLPPLHASRWPTLSALCGRRVRLTFFGEDVLRVEASGVEAPSG